MPNYNILIFGTHKMGHQKIVEVLSQVQGVSFKLNGANTFITLDESILEAVKAKLNELNLPIQVFEEATEDVR